MSAEVAEDDSLVVVRLVERRQGARHGFEHRESALVLTGLQQGGRFFVLHHRLKLSGEFVSGRQMRVALQSLPTRPQRFEKSVLRLEDISL